MPSSLSPAKSSQTADRELVLSRVFDAPMGVVFEAWTNPVHVPHWWGPFGFTTTIHEMDVRPGGVWRHTMHGPDGRDYHNRIVFLEVEKPRRLVYTHEPEAGSESFTCHVTVTFQNQGSKTHVTMQMLFPTPASLDYALKTRGVEEGGKQTLARLAQHLVSMAEQNKHLVIKRTFAAPREVVFKAWTDPKQLAEWWGPRGFTNPVCDIDVRPAGRFLIHMRSPQGHVYPVIGHFTEVDPPERIAFITKVDGAENGPQFEILNTVTFVEESPNRTSLTLDVLVLKSNEAALANLAGAQMGWSQSLERLAALVESEPKVIA